MVSAGEVKNGDDLVVALVEFDKRELSEECCVPLWPSIVKGMA